MGFHILVRRHLYIESGPSAQWCWSKLSCLAFWPLYQVPEREQMSIIQRQACVYTLQYGLDICNKIVDYSSITWAPWRPKPLHWFFYSLFMKNKHQGPTLAILYREIERRPVDSPHKVTVMWKEFPCNTILISNYNPVPDILSQMHLTSYFQSLFAPRVVVTKDPFFRKFSKIICRTIQITFIFDRCHGNAVTPTPAKYKRGVKRLNTGYFWKTWKITKWTKLDNYPQAWCWVTFSVFDIYDMMFLKLEFFTF